MAEPEYQRGSGTNPGETLLPQGAATALNNVEGSMPPQSLPEPSPSPATGAPPPLPVGKPREPDFKPSSDAEHFLFSPGTGPDSGITPQGKVAPPADAAEWLGYLQEAALDPSSSADGVRTLLQSMAAHMDGG